MAGSENIIISSSSESGLAGEEMKKAAYRRRSGVSAIRHVAA